MATLIVVGKAEAVYIVDGKTGDYRSDHDLLKDNERLCVRIKVERVLYPPSGEPPFFFPKNVTLGEAEVVFGDRHTDLMPFRKTLTESSHIYYLTTHVERSGPPNYYPFFDWSNLCDPVSKEPEVTRLIAAFEAVQ